jgi:hypothetical protein
MELIWAIQILSRMLKIFRQCIILRITPYRSWTFCENNTNMSSLCVGLENLVLTYVNSINIGSLPCMENTVQALAHVENSVAVQKAL